MKIPWLDSLPPRRRRWILWVGGAILFYTLAGFLIAPPIVRAVAAQQIGRRLNREVSIAKVRLNPYAMSATIRGFLIKDRDGQPFVSWDEVYANLRFFSLFTRTLAFQEVRTSQPFIHVQVNPDYSLNFSDILARLAEEAAAGPKPGAAAKPGKPHGLRVDQLRISGARFSLTDLTTREPFTKSIGPLELALQNFATDPENKNPYSFAGSTAEGERFSWSGHFFLDPVRSIGSLALENISLAKYAPLYQDLVRFNIQDGFLDVHSSYHVEQGAITNIARLTNATLQVRSFKIGEQGANETAVDIPQFTIDGISADAFGRSADVSSIATSGGRLSIRRNADASVNLIELAAPNPAATNAAGSVVVLLQSVTNLVNLLLRSTNNWAGSIHDIRVDDYALALEDLSTARPVRLDLDEIHVAVRNVSNQPGSNLTAEVRLRWNTNGTIRTEASLGLFPLEARVKIDLDGLEVRALDPYLEPFLNLHVTQGQVGLHGRIALLSTTNTLPDLSFQGDLAVDDFATVDGLLTEDFVQFKALRISGIDARVSPLGLSVKEVSLLDARTRLIIESEKTNNLFVVLRKTAEIVPASALPEPARANAPKPATPGKTRGQAPMFSIPTNLIAAAQASLPKISLNLIALTNVKVGYTDRSVKPAVHLTVDELGGSITGLSSEDLTRADVHLIAKVGRSAPMEVTGKINLLSRSDYTDLKVVFRNIELIPTSPYAGKFLGYRLNKGKLSLDVEYQLVDGKLKGKNLITLDQLILGEKVPSPDATKLPIKLALAILKDRSGRIELDVPVEGSLADPEFKLGKVITRALMNVLTKIVTSPFAVLGAVFGGKGEEVSYQEFAPGSVELSQPNRDKLDAFAKGLYERPGLQVEIEAATDPVADREALRRLKLQQQFRTQKWNSLRKSERARLTPEQVELAPEEFQAYLKDALAALPPAASPAAVLGAPSVPAARTPATRPLGASPEAYVKGATALLTERNKTTPGSEPPAAAGTQEQRLLETIVITDSDYAMLAAERAKRVRDYLLQNGHVESERVFIAEKADDTKPATGTRVLLHLR